MAKKTPTAGGRPSAYREEYAEQAYKICLLWGGTDKELANYFGVGVSTITNWKKAHPEFMDCLTAGKDAADANVAASLYQRACGYSHPDTHVAVINGKVVTTPLVKHHPPDTKAAMHWLHNRQPTHWRNRVELTGTDGRDLEFNVVFVKPKAAGNDGAD